eukprot:gnl/Dysnectes_brevis/1282_a1437_3701.p1 GENE.gnl/Dysnectes_brevis/1282_a1437_3701~~gnl/Dysnectes_brevis/1282_a1437_3701.p1  ORF type:complete len:237 (+),score=21.87 gnl/Dysnectes_brevis/1282_a1437_3701:145-855(+)
MSSVVLKLLIVGPPFSGKTAFVQCATHGTLTTSYKPTLGADFSHKVVHVEHGDEGTPYTVQLQLFDLAGQDNQSVLFRAFTQDAHAALCFMDLSNPDCWRLHSDSDSRAIRSPPTTFEFFDQVKDLKLPGTEDVDIPIFLVLNKTDLLKTSDPATMLAEQVAAFTQATGPVSDVRYVSVLKKPETVQDTCRSIALAALSEALMHANPQRMDSMMVVPGLDDSDSEEEGGKGCCGSN